MSKTLLILLLAALCCLNAWSQVNPPVHIKGRIIDKDSQQPLMDAVVTLLNAKDSSRVTAAFTDKNGAFTLQAHSGAYLLHVTYIGYRQRQQLLNITNESLQDIGAISLQKTGVTLGLVEIVEQRVPMVVKKDTLEFNADYYKLRQNAVVEQLLKKIPGIEIDKEGNIKVNGQPVKSILVNGQPFFGSNPTLATRNLSADLIDKIQLIDQRAYQSQFSGTNNEQTEKMINITIKKENNNKFTGRFLGGYGTDDRYAAAGNLNRFGDHALTLLGQSNNANGAHESGIPIGGYGIAKTSMGGVNYNTAVNSALKISSNAYVNYFNTTEKRQVQRQNLLPDTTYYYNQDADNGSSATNYAAGTHIEYKPDTSQRMVLSVSISRTTENNKQQSAYESLGDKKQPVNSGTTLLTGNSTRSEAGVLVSYRKRFKAGREFSASFIARYQTAPLLQFNRSLNYFFNPDGSSQSDSINQYATTGNHGYDIILNMAYAYPLYKNHFLDATYSYNRNQTTTEKNTYDFNTIAHVYNLLNDSLSNAFRNIAQVHRAGISFREQKERYDYSIGIALQLSSLRSNNISQQIVQQQTAGIFPAAAFNYAFANNRRLKLQYSGNLQQPDITLLQPVPDNTNPLYIKLGNPDLKPAVMHAVNMSYNSVNPASFKTTMVAINATMIRNKIIMASWLDSLGRQVSKPLNANGAWFVNTNITNSFAIKKWQTNINSTTTLAVNRDINYTNGQWGHAYNLAAGQNLSCSYAYKQLLDGTLATGVSYNSVHYSQQKGNNINVYTWYCDFSYNLTLPLEFSLGANINYQHNTGIAPGNNVNIILLNATIEKSLFARKQALIRLQAFDLLSQNKGYTRTFGVNYVEDTQTQVLPRFFLCSFIYMLKP
ncbi:MAG TPA: outer membrane beta-barrel protein [Chitinophaga sp.]|uniref:outer membrane beta-barrel protein n=1 Tax=Chitinophaga sp. TaxID=1869181 RepID=UPI002DB64CCA|nr:outer membrane beta-barrel protein [Chitinophaga sp.]HEU4552459.1 outer membrane beta-barrel protein [Chitinophaga sp.]